MVALVDVAGRFDNFTNKLWAFSIGSSSKAGEKSLNSLGLRPRFRCVPWFPVLPIFSNMTAFQRIGLDKKLVMTLRVKLSDAVKSSK
jgi:hypothetical protein